MELRARADAQGVDVIALDAWCARHGLWSWHDPALWHRAKQEIHPNAAPFYGDLVARLLAAAQGTSAKVLVLDLDNTLWGGIIGEDGLAGIALGQGSAAGEAFTEFQRYVHALGRRGIILAVCSKNEESNALEPFERHPEMILKRDDIACVMANWDDKATNLRAIAATLNVALDSVVFVDDNPAERAIVRRELPMVAVPELPSDVSLFPAALSEAGYFEGRQITQDDLARGRHYQANAARSRHIAATTDMEGYLRSLEMRAIWGRFDAANKARVVQLVNKTNQFNLTTRRITDAEVDTLIEDSSALTVHIRLVDRFGDNGIIAVVIGAFAPDSRDMELHTWLMSCRVLGRGVENSTLNIIAEQARALGAERLIGVYRPSAKNAMVRDHYAKLGFVSLNGDGTRFALDLGSWNPRVTYIQTEPYSS
jgi:FkbH-like protein